jgi:hypothetical protein
MEDTKKPNDMFAAVMQAPDVNVYDLAKSQITPENTQLLNKDFYKNSDVVQEMFKDEKGNFNTLAFDNAYSKAALTFSELSNDQQFAKLLEWDPYDYTAPLNDKHYDVRPSVGKDRNPFKSVYSRTGINSVDANDLSLRELAQAGKVFDTKTNQWSDKSANELSFFDKFTGDTLVYAQYDKDEVSIDALTGQKQTHKKGDWKFDSDGNLFIETLGDREMYGKQIVNPMDLLTVDGSAMNKVDFFDSDGKTKTIAGTTAKLMVEIAPFLIPGVQSFYGAYKMAMGLSYVLPTFYKAIEGILTGDTSAGNETPMWKAMNSTQGYLAKYNQRSTSDEAAGSLLNYEQLTGIVSDIYSQIYEQRAAANLSKLFYKEKELDYINTLNKTAQDQLKVLSVVDDMSKITRTEENYAKIAQRAASKIGELSEVTKKRSALAKDLNLAYMAMTQSADMYGEALAGGYDRRTAGAAALMGAAGQFALMRNNPLGDWFLDNAVGYNNEKAGMIKAFKGLRTKIRENHPGIQEAMTTMASNKVAGKTKLSSIFTNIKSNFKGFLDEANTMDGIGGNIARNSMVEGIEEVSEQAVLDMSKGVIDFLSYTGLTGKEGSFGGFDVVFSKTGFENYLANLVGGVVGGAMFETERSIISPLMTTGAISRPTQLDAIDFVSNGKAKEFLEVAKEYSKNYASPALSAVATDVDGRKIYLGNNENMSQSDFMYNTVESYINNVDRILNSENVKQSNEDWVRKAIIDEVKIQDMQRNNTDSFIISDVKEKLVDLVNLKTAVELAQAKGEDVTAQLGKIKQLTNELDQIQSGEMADDYYGLSIFTLNDKFHKPFLSLSVDSYVETKYNKIYNTLPEAEKKAMDAEFTAIMNGDGQFKNRMKAAYGEFKVQNANFSKVLEDYSKGGYDILRRSVFKELYTNKNLFEQTVKDKDFGALKELWSNISSLNTELSKIGLKTPGLNQPIDIDFGKFLIDTGVISLGLSDNEIATILKVEPEDIDLNLKAQAILNRLEVEGFDLENTTLEELKAKIEDENDSFILPPEKEILRDTILNTGVTTVKEAYHPEVFADVDSTTISDEEKVQLSTMFNMHVPTMETMEGDLLAKIVNTINNSRRGNTKTLTANRLAAEPTDLEGIKSLESQISTLSGMKNMRVHTKTEVLNKSAFLNSNADKFYTQFVESLAKANISVVGQTIQFGELQSGQHHWLEQINEHLLDNSLDPLNEYKAFADLSKILLEALSPMTEQVKALEDDLTNLAGQAVVLENELKTNPTMEQSLVDEINSRLLAIQGDFRDIQTQIVTIASKENLSKIIYSVLSDGLNLLLQTEALLPSTRTVAETSKLMMNNVQGQYLLSPDFYNTSEQIFTSPTAQLLTNFAEAIMAQGGKLDYEIVEALKEEYTKLNQAAAGLLDVHRQDLIKRLETVINYGNVQHNTLLDKLRQIQINLYQENKGVKSAFDLLRELNVSFAQSTSPAEFKLDVDALKLVDKALYTLDMVRAVMAAMTTTDVSMDATVVPSPEFLYGYNVSFNKMYAKQGIATQLGLLGSEDIQLLTEELDKIEGKLRHFRVLSENNSGSTLQEQDKIKTAILSALLDKFTSAKKDSLSLLQLGHNGRMLLTSDDLDKAEKLGLEEKISFLEDVVKKNFDEMVGGNDKNIIPILNSIFEPFNKEELKVKTDYTILDNPDSNLTSDMTQLETKDWYVYLHSMLASSSYNFYELYKKYQEKEVSLSENFRAPFFTQQFIMRQAFGYINGTRGKAIMSHIVSFIVPEFDSGLDITNATTFSEGFIKNMDKSTGLALSNLFFIRGTSGTGKSDILSNFILWALTDKDSKLLGNTLKITALAPTEKTKLVLEKSINRNINAIIESNTVDTFIENLIPTSSAWIDRINTLKSLTGSEYKNDVEMQYTDSATGTTKGSGIFIVSDSAAFTKETLELMFSSIKNDTPQILIIDEASKINSLQYQVLNYLAKEKNYYIVVLGDDLQEGVILGKTTTSLENMYMPSSVKLKSTIRAENIHQNNNNITLEHWVNAVRNNVFFLGPEAKPVILDYALYNGVLHGEKISTLKSLVDDLKTLDTTKEIVFITDDGKLSEDQQNIIKAAYGETFIATAKVFGTDVQGEEFGQVVILASLDDTHSADASIAKYRTAKKIYTLLSRAKIATIIVGENKYLTNQQKDISAPKELNPKEVKEYLTARFEEITNLLKNLEALKPVASGSTAIVPAVVTVPDDVMEVLNQIVPDVNGEEGITEVFNAEIDNENIDLENKIETNKTTQETKDSIEEAIVTNKDIKIKGYSYYLNLGKTLSDNMDVAQIADWVSTIDENSTDFAKYVYLQKSGKYSPDNFKNFPDATLKEFYDDLNQFILVRNEILSKVLKETNVPNSNNLVKVNDKVLGEQTLDLATDFYIRVAKTNSYSQPYGQRIQKKLITQTQYFLTVNINGIPVSLFALADENTAINQAKNIKGDSDALKVQYAKLKNSNTGEVPINLVGNIKYLTGVKTLINDVVDDKIEIDATRDNIVKQFPGAKVEAYGAFRGPSFNSDGTLDQTSVRNFIKELQSFLNMYNKTPVTVIDINTIEQRNRKHLPKHQVPYQRYMFRPYALITYNVGNTIATKPVLLYSKQRPFSQFWDDLSSTKIIKSSLISKYQS